MSGSVTGSSYLMRGLGFGVTRASARSTRITVGPASFAGFGFLSFGPAGLTGLGFGVFFGFAIAFSIGFVGFSSSMAAVSAVFYIGFSFSFGLGFIAFAFFFAAGIFFFLIRTFFRSTFSAVSIDVMCSPSLNHSRIVAASPAEIVDIWFLTSRPSSWHFLTIAGLFTPSSFAKM
jgi:hypothetical protein